MRIIAIFALTAILGACASALPGDDERMSASLNKATANIGKTFWVAQDRYLPGVNICDQSTMNGKCEDVSKGKFAVQSIETREIQVGLRHYEVFIGVYRVAFDDGRTGYITENALEAYSTDKDPAIAAAECKRRGNPRIGMTVDQVIATCWGKPETVNRTETGKIIFDQYVYSGGRYVYLRNGVVKSMQASGTLAH